MSLIFNGDMMYCGVFSPIEGVGGVFKAPVPERLSINEIPKSLQSVVYPNPANDFISLHFPNELQNQSSLIITDVLGRVHYNKSIGNESGNTISVYTENWASGLYIYTISSGASKTSGKFIVE